MESPFKRHEPLYLKYRPQSLGELVGQEGVHRTLVNAIEHNRLSHAYLFTGPRGTGKTSTARILAKSLNCKTAGRPTVEPCQTCACCDEITKGISTAVFEIDAASNNSVDDARALIERAPLKAVGGEFKVYIIDECHMLTKEAFNALLKTIEQPPPGVVFILATTEEHKVLPTIVSRCQRLMFKLINQEALGKHLRKVSQLENIEIEEEALQLIARRSGGGLRDALSNLDQASLLAAPGAPATVSDLLRLLGALHEDVLLDISRQIAERSGQEVIDSVNKLLGEGREPQVVLQELSRHFLNLMKSSYLNAGAGADPQALRSIVLGSESYINGLMSQVSLFERSELSQIIEQIDRLEQTTRRSSQPAMHLEIGLLGICHRHDIHLLKDLLLRVQRLEEQGAPLAHESDGHHRSHAPQQALAPQASRQLSPQASAPSRPSYQAEAPAPRPQALQEPAGVPVASAQAAQASIHSVSLVDQEERQSAVAQGARHQVQAEPETEHLPQSAPIAPAKTATQEPAAQREQVPSQATETAPAKSGDPRIDDLNADIDYLWQQVLDELQRRHLPTFSLASTHAFPLSVSSNELAIGVLKENFQKMLESKADHMKAALQAVTGLDLVIRIRVSAASAPAPAKKAASSSLQNPQAPQQSQSNQNQGQSQAPAMRTSPPADLPDTDAEENANPQSSSGPSLVANPDEVDQTMLKEAYKLFEGPGSRRIT